jgi:urease accessory protein
MAERVTDLAAVGGGRVGEWLVWQLADSAFPIGGFAHSGGVEAAWQGELARHPREVEGILRQLLHQAAAGSAPFVIAAHRNPERFSEFDELLDSMLTSHVANRASRLQGGALLSSAGRIFGGSSETLRSAVLAGGHPGHFAVAFGALTRALGVEEETALRLYLFMTLRGCISAAVRLGALGPLNAQSVQAAMGAELESLVAVARATPLEAAAQTAPLLELIQGTQDRLYSRLFQS